jgi:hypothetical protein
LWGDEEDADQPEARRPRKKKKTKEPKIYEVAPATTTSETTTEEPEELDSKEKEKKETKETKEKKHKKKHDDDDGDSNVGELMTIDVDDQETNTSEQALLEGGQEGDEEVLAGEIAVDAENDIALNESVTSLVPDDDPSTLLLMPLLGASNDDDDDEQSKRVRGANRGVPSWMENTFVISDRSAKTLETMTKWIDPIIIQNLKEMGA